MVFSSSIFLFGFLPVTLAGYYLIRSELRNIFLLTMSLLFYAWGEPRFVFIMMASIAVNYSMGRLIALVQGNTFLIKRFVLILAICANLSILFYYKYFDFFISNIKVLTGLEIPLRHIALPIGISFFTFQGMSYIFDLYMGKVEEQKNPLNIALYIALFPQLIAGPIVRYNDINQQLEHRICDFNKFGDGVKRFILGLGKKIIIANSFAIIADKAFSTPSSELSVTFAWIGVIAYAFQIYFDFSGYSDMAIGLGKMFGFEFLENFNYPYISKSITEFWRRWHISLSTWFRDYVYIPLGGNRRGNVYVNLFIVFLVTGLWHGASWNFILWGLWHGFFLIFERVVRKNNIKIHVPGPFKWLYMIIIVLLGWVLFRSTNIEAAFSYIKNMLGMQGNVAIDAMSGFIISEYWILFIFAILFSMPLAPKFKQVCSIYLIPSQIGKILTPVLYIGLFIISISYTLNSSYNPFIYFNF